MNKAVSYVDSIRHVDFNEDSDNGFNDDFDDDRTIKYPFILDEECRSLSSYRSPVDDLFAFSDKEDDDSVISTCLADQKVCQVDNLFLLTYKSQKNKDEIDISQTPNHDKYIIRGTEVGDKVAIDSEISSMGTIEIVDNSDNEQMESLNNDTAQTNNQRSSKNGKGVDDAIICIDSDTSSEGTIDLVDKCDNDESIRDCKTQSMLNHCATSAISNSRPAVISRKIKQDNVIDLCDSGDDISSDHLQTQSRRKRRRRNKQKSDINFPKEVIEID